MLVIVTYNYHLADVSYVINVIYANIKKIRVAIIKDYRIGSYRLVFANLYIEVYKDLLL